MCVGVVRADELAVGGHDLRREQVVDRHAVLADEVADPAARRDPADPDRAGVAEPDRQPVLADRGRAARPAVRPASAQTVRPSTSMSIAFISRRSSTIPPSVVLWPAALCPPLRTASSRPVARARPTDRRDIVGAGRPDDDRRAGVALHERDPRLVVAGVVRADDGAADGGPQVAIERVSGRGGRRGSRGAVLLSRAPAADAARAAYRTVGRRTGREVIGRDRSEPIITICNETRNRVGPARAVPSVHERRAPACPGIAFLLSQLGGQSSRAWKLRLATLGLEPREVMLFRFVALAEGRSQREVAAAIGLPASRIVALVDRLERQGWVERRSRTTIDEPMRSMSPTRAGASWSRSGSPHSSTKPT